MGEGAAVLVLEREEHAPRPRREDLARVGGYGASNDAFHITQPEENGRGADRGDEDGAERRRRRPGDIGYVNAHGTRPRSTTASRPGHPRGPRRGRPARLVGQGRDRPHARRRRRDRGARLRRGDRRGALPPTLGLEDIDPECEADHVAGAPREAPDLKVALSNSFAFGGQNATLVLQAA